jgi:hypothetical protein
MTKILVVLDRLISIIESTKAVTDDPNDVYGQNEMFNHGVDSSISKIKSFKRFLIDMEIEQ